jgi:iron(III) transport system ATP-binding protein
MADAVLTVKNAVKSLGGHGILKGVDLQLYCGNVSAVLGPSGAGKSTLLRAIAGLERLDSGQIDCAGAIWDGNGQFIPTEKRQVGVVFQDYALFPHLTVEKNIAFGLRGALTQGESQSRVTALLESAELGRVAQSFPHELSGGEQQRVALARALAPRPDIILLDEPFSSLDRRLRSELRSQTIDTIRAAGAAALIVTHDADEAFEAADHIYLMEDGKIIQQGDPATVYARPNSLTSARLLGDINLIDVTAKSGLFDTPFGPISASAFPDDSSARLLVRPEAIHESRTGRAFTANSIFIRQGRQRLRTTAPDGTGWIVDLPLTRVIKKGETIRLALDENALTLLSV